MGEVEVLSSCLGTKPVPVFLFGRGAFQKGQSSRKSRMKRFGDVDFAVSRGNKLGMGFSTYRQKYDIQSESLGLWTLSIFRNSK
jgi:hypothetical protein